MLVKKERPLQLRLTECVRIVWIRHIKVQTTTKERRVPIGQSAVLVKRERHQDCQSIVSVVIVALVFIKVQMIILARLVQLGVLVLLVNLW